MTKNNKKQEAGFIIFAGGITYPRLSHPAMATVTCLTFNAFQENTYIVSDASGDCVVFDPGCSDSREQRALCETLERLGVKPVRLINTHAHIDHILGNRFVADTFGLVLEIHAGELPLLERAGSVAAMYGIPYPEPSPMPGRYLVDGEEIRFGSTVLQILFTPGHSPASLSFYSAADGFLLAGDVLFRESIGRTDLPGCDHRLLLDSIRERIFPLPGETVVWPGHGEPTTIGHEKQFNPFVGD